MRVAGIGRPFENLSAFPGWGAGTRSGIGCLHHVPSHALLPDSQFVRTSRLARPRIFGFRVVRRCRRELRFGRIVSYKGEHEATYCSHARTYLREADGKGKSRNIIYPWPSGRLCATQTQTKYSIGCKLLIPEKLQHICDSLGPEDIDRMFCKWLDRIPLPLRPEDRRAGYDWDLSIWQMEVSLTQIFDRPLRGREFFEEVIRDNLDWGGPTGCS